MNDSTESDELEPRADLLGVNGVQRPDISSNSPNEAPTPHKNPTLQKCTFLPREGTIFEKILPHYENVFFSEENVSLFLKF